MNTLKPVFSWFRNNWTLDLQNAYDNGVAVVGSIIQVTSLYPLKRESDTITFSFIIIIIITLQTANPNWESLMSKTQRPQQGRQHSKERENFRTNMKTETKTSFLNIACLMQKLGWSPICSRINFSPIHTKDSPE